MAEKYNIVVIGSGPGGYRAAVLAALRGRRVAIVEKAVWGGCCLNRGCVPKKTWYHTANAVAASRGFSERGITGELRADLGRAWQHQKQVVDTVRGSYLDYLKRLGIGVHTGAATLRDPHTVGIAGDGGSVTVGADYVVLATGSTPCLPEGIAAAPGRVLTTDMLFDMPPPPGRRVAVVGAGAIGAEFAYILSMLGREVTLFASREPLSTHRFSVTARAALMSALREYSIDVVTGVRLNRVHVRSDGIELKFSDGEVRTYDWMLLGTGRKPNTAGLNLDAVGIARDARGFVCTNPRLQTSVPSVYAIGDCISPVMTANQALADAALAVDNIVRGNCGTRDPAWVPEVVYSALELARVGLSEDEAEEAEFEPAVGFTAFERSPAALAGHDARGFVRLLADMERGTLLGGEIVGVEAGELVHLLALAPDRDAALSMLARARVNHPARAEEFVNAAETLARRWGLGETIFGD